MKPLLHLFKKDSREQRFGLGIWFVLVTFRLAYDLRPLDPNNAGFPSVFLPLFCLIAAVTLVLIPAITADSLGNHQAFYRTRPIRARDLVGAKILFLLVWIILPACASEALFLAKQSLPLNFFVVALAERFIYLGVFGVAIGAAATAFHSTSSVVRNSLTCLPIILASFLFWPWLAIKWNLPSLGASVTSPVGLLLAGVVIALICSAHAWRAHAHDLRWFSRWAPLGLVAFMAPLFSAQWQSQLGTSKPLETIVLTPSVIPDSAMRVSAFAHSNGPDKTQVQVTISPRRERSQGLVSEWSVIDMTVRDPQLKRRSDGFRRPTGKVFHRRSQTGNRGQDIGAIATLLPPEIHIAHDTFSHWPVHQNVMASLATTVSPDTPDDLTSIVGELRGRHFEWKLVGILELDESSYLTSQGTSWHFLKIERNHNKAIDIKLEWERPTLSLTHNQRWRSHSDDGLARHEILVYQEEDQIAFAPDSVFTFQDRGLLRAYRRSVMTLQFRQAGGRALNLPEIDPSKAKILVFEKIFQYQETLAWEKSDVRITQHYQAPNTNLRPPVKLSRHEFQRQLQRLGSPPTGTSRTEAGKYLYNVVKLVRARDEWIRPESNLATLLAPLAQEHPEMFLDGLRSAQHRASQLLLAALQRGTPADQKDLIIERLPSQLNLSDMILARDWIEPARAALITIAKERRQLPISVVRSLIMLKEANVYPQLLDDFQAYPSLSFYDALRTVPSLEEELDRRVRLIWEHRPRVTSHRPNIQSIYSIALRHGMREPLVEIYQVLSWIKHDLSLGFEISRAIRDNVVLTGLSRHEWNNSDRVLAWLLRQDPDRFRYDPARRMFFVDNKA